MLDKSKFNAVQSGILLGVLGLILRLVLYFIDIRSMILYSDIIGVVFVFVCMIIAVSNYKSKIGKGYVSFQNAFREGWLTYVLGTTIITLGMFLFVNYLAPEIKDLQKSVTFEVLEAFGKIQNQSQEDKDALHDVIESADPYSVRALAQNLPFSFIMPGALFSMFVALAMRKNPPTASH